MQDWKIYERFVAKLMYEQVEYEHTVIPNAKLIGQISGVKRQIDVLIDSRFNEQNSRRTIVDAKYHKRPIDVKHVEEFEGMMRDVGAHHGILVCPEGYTPAAFRRAQELITIYIVPLEELEGFEYSLNPCSDKNCNGYLQWGMSPSLIINGIIKTFMVGICDQCHKFNIRCWGCGEKVALSAEDQQYCSCG